MSTFKINNAYPWLYFKENIFSLFILSVSLCKYLSCDQADIKIHYKRIDIKWYRLL